MPLPDEMADAGSYLTEVKNKYGYDRSAFPMGYMVTCCSVEVYFDKKDY